jgi:MYXO-CTERM domain-containing protein
MPCEQKTEQTCVPRYQLPCKVAADCGTGFECEQTERCSSSDSGGAQDDPSGSGVAPPAEPAPPQCVKTGEFHCTAELTTCSVASDCPSGWTCVTVEERRGSSSDPSANPPPLPGTDGSEPDSAGAAPQDTPLPPESTTTRSYCAPPYYDLNIRGSLGGSIAGSDSNDSAGSLQDPSKSEGESRTPSGDKTSGGCRTSAGRTGSSGALLGTLGLLGLLRRRIRRPATELG